jgi:nitrogen regulatory protein P-II 1
MKKLEFIIKNEDLKTFKKILIDCNANNMIISNIKHYDSQNAYKRIFRGTEYTVDLLRKVKIEIVVVPEAVDFIISKVLKEINNGGYKDGRILISDIKDVV